MDNNIPDYALKITGQYSGPVVYFHVWRVCNCPKLHLLGGWCNNYIWDALGNQGEGRTLSEAISGARHYVLYGEDSSYMRTGYGYDNTL